MTPSTQNALRVAALFNRRPTTPWSEKEIKVYKKLVKDALLIEDNMEVIERYYVYERRKGDKGIHRRDLYTFLNNFSGELDRARAWDEIKRKQLSANVSRNKALVSQSDQEFNRISELAKAEFQRFKENFR